MGQHIQIDPTYLIYLCDPINSEYIYTFLSIENIL